MSIEIIGVFTHGDGAEHRPQPLSNLDLSILKELVQSYDHNGYNPTLIPNAGMWPHRISFAASIAGITKSLKFMSARRPGFVAPTMAARILMTIDRLCAGFHIITGGNDKEMEADADFLTKEQRYARSAEYVDVLRKI